MPHGQAAVMRRGRVIVEAVGSSTYGRARSIDCRGPGIAPLQAGDGGHEEDGGSTDC